MDTEGVQRARNSRPFEARQKSEDVEGESE